MRTKVLLAAMAILAPVASAQAPRIAPPVPTRVVALSRPAVAEAPTVAVRRASATRLAIGGALGALAGLASCYLISEAIEEVEDSSHCTAKGNLMFAAGGAVLGIVIAAITD